MSTKNLLLVFFLVVLLLFGGVFLVVKAQTINPWLVWETYVVGTNYNGIASQVNCTSIVITAGSTCVCPSGFTLYSCNNYLMKFDDNSVYSNYTLTIPTFHLKTTTTGNGTCSETLSGSIGGSLSGTVTGCPSGVLAGSITSGTSSLSSSGCSNTFQSTYEQQVPEITASMVGTRQVIWNYQCVLRALCLATPQLMASQWLALEDSIESLKAKIRFPPQISHKV